MTLPLLLAVTVGLAVAAGDDGPVAWQPWSDAQFERARREGRLVLLDLEAVWCHWCHVMDQTTYRDPEVAGLIRSAFIPVRVDQDSRPDLAHRYEDYGWPATVVFDGTGRELVKFQGYIPPRRMASLLKALIDDPTPGPSVTEKPDVAPAAGAFTAELRQELAALLVERYDPVHGGWGFSHKYLDGDSVEWCLARARAGDEACAGMARDTLDRQITHLLDPVWGGVYQYSDGGVWTNPHFEKIMSTQAENLRSFAQAYAQWREPRHLQAARDVHRYLQEFLKSPEGAFYTSQDADLVPGEPAAGYFALSDAERRRRGLPQVDRHRYARENAWVVQALVALHAATGDPAPLAEAVVAARWIVDHRSLPGGGFRHDAEDTAGPYLGDTLAAGRAFLSLYSATADQDWLQRAEAAAAFIAARFAVAGVPGFVTAFPSGAATHRPAPERDENVGLARFANLLSRYTGRPEHRRLADDALAYLAHPAVARRFNTGGVLLADMERASDPLHVTVVGPRNDPAVRALLQTALADPAAYKRVELLDRSADPLPNLDVEYPVLARSAAFVCAEGRCSAPAYGPDELRRRLEGLRAVSGPRRAQGATR